MAQKKKSAKKKPRSKPKTKARSQKKSSAKKKSAKKKSAKKPGLYANIHRAQERAAHGGRPVRKKGAKGAPTERAFKKSKRTARKP